MIALAAAALLAASPPSLLGITANEQPGRITVTAALSAAPVRVTANYWAGRLYTLAVDLHGIRLAMRPGEAWRGRLARVRTGQYAPRVARIVVESQSPFRYAVYAVARSAAGLSIEIQLSQPGAGPQPTPGPQPSRAAAPTPGPQAPPRTLTQAAARTFSITASGPLEAVAQTIAVITGEKISVHPAAAGRHVVLNLPAATVQQALAELARQAGVRWTRTADGSIEIAP